MDNVLLKTKDLCKSFSNNGEQNHVLNQVSMEIYQGDFTVIMGSSGSGKSTLLYCISGMDTITSGEVWYEGKPVNGMKEKEMAMLRRGGFGFVFQQMHLVSNLSLFENVAVPGYLNKSRTTKETNERAEKLLEQVNIQDAMKRLPSQVSGGEQQRAAIARAMINEPRLLFADEPTGALNQKNTKDVMALLAEINQGGQSILMVTHDVRAAIYGNRILYLEDGRIIGELKLAPFKMEEARSRETQITSWLASMSW